MTDEEKANDSGYDSPVLAPQPRQAEAIISPTPQDRAQGLAGLLLGADYSSAQEDATGTNPLFLGLFFDGGQNIKKTGVFAAARLDVGRFSFNLYFIFSLLF